MSEEEITESGFVEAALLASHQKFTSVLSSGIDLESRTIYVIGEIEEKIAYHFMAALAHFDSTPGNITIVISSPGGVEHYGYAMYDALCRTRNTVIMEGYGIVASMAAVIFQGADVRYLSENTDYLIHNGSIHVGEGVVAQDSIVQMADQVKKDTKKYYRILFDNSDLSMEEIKKFCDDEKSFNPQEALAAGLADKVLKPTPGKSRKKTKKKKKK